MTNLIGKRLSQVSMYTRKWSLTVWSYHVTYVFQSESTLYIFLNIKKLLAWGRRNIWNLSDRNATQTHNHLVRKRTINHLAKLDQFGQMVDYLFMNKWIRVRVPLQIKLLNKTLSNIFMNFVSNKLITVDDREPP